MTRCGDMLPTDEEICASLSRLYSETDSSILAQANAQLMAVQVRSSNIRTT